MTRRVGAVVVMCCVAGASGLAAQGGRTVSDEDRAVLVSLFEATNGPNWKDKSGWLGPRGTECQWAGVRCWTPGRISGLVLVDQGLTGQLPDDLGKLHLSELLLWGNHLSGPLPASIRAQWESHELALMGYASQFDAGVTSVAIRTFGGTMSGCVGTVVLEHTIRVDGTVLAHERECSLPDPLGDYKYTCSVKTGQLYPPEIDLLVDLMVKSGFFEMKDHYAPSPEPTDLLTVEIAATRNGAIKRVSEYGHSGPRSLWPVQRAAYGVLAEVSWRSETPVNNCIFPN